MATCIVGDPPALTPDDIGRAGWHYGVPIRRVTEVKLRAIGVHRSQLPGGEATALFPAGIVKQLLAVERFEDATGDRQAGVAATLASLSVTSG